MKFCLTPTYCKSTIEQSESQVLYPSIGDFLIMLTMPQLEHAKGPEPASTMGLSGQDNLLTNGGHLADEKTSYRNGRRRGADARVLHVENADN
jgi:hypothetical protein